MANGLSTMAKDDWPLEAKERIATLENDLRTIEALRLGTYYASLSDIGDTKNIKFDSRWYKEIKRSGTSLTVAGMDASSAKQQTKKFKTTHIDGTKRKSAEIAHMLAFSSKCATFCAEFVQGAAGVDFSGDSHNNMARILHQGKYVDLSPSVLMMPILELDGVKKPDPPEYDVAIICESASVYQELVLTEEAEICTPAEIKMAVDRLNEFVQAAGFYLSTRSDEDFNVLGSSEKKKLKDSWKKITSTGYSGRRVPTLDIVSDEKLRGVKVMKVRFSNASEAGHSYVDPWLLLMKNAIMFSDMMDLKLLPGCDFGASKEDSTSQDEGGSGSGIPMTISVADGSASSDITDIE